MSDGTKGQQEMDTPQEESGWVIERGDSQPSAPIYWIGVQRWDSNHMEAVRFARKQDAEKVAHSLRDGGYHRIAEHAWSPGPARETRHG